jgi:uncharacterized protein YndB with AHSA1/START domain
MVNVEASVMIDRPVEEVWKFIMDLSKTPTWDTGVLEVKQTSTGPVGVGSTCDFRARMMMRNMTISMRITEYEPNRRFSFEHTSGPMEGSIITFSIENIDGKTRFTFSHDLKLSGFYKLLGVMKGRMRREVVAILNNAKRILESEAKS